jgi:hypothetical protein
MPLIGLDPWIDPRKGDKQKREDKKLQCARLRSTRAARKPRGAVVRDVSKCPVRLCPLFPVFGCASSTMFA